MHAPEEYGFHATNAFGGERDGRAAPIERESSRAGITFQKGHDLGAA
jgi:hypothetical protein